MQKGNLARILVVDDELIVRKSLGNWLREEGYQVGTAESADEALHMLAQEEWDIYLIDIRMPGMDGLELQQRVAKAAPNAAIILMTAYASVDTAVEAMKLGAYDYIVKPFEPDDLERLIQKALERQQLLNENAFLLEESTGLNPYLDRIGLSESIHQVFREIESASASEIPVLILGGMGSGRELAARAIHNLSGSRFLPFASLTCGLASEILTSELIGHEAAALSGAQHRRKGKFEAVNGGTIYLDEVGLLPIEAQLTVLKVLNEQEVTRSGGTRPIPVSFRLITASEEEIEQLAREGRFSVELFHKVAEFTIRIPPLTERKEDISVLANYYLRKLRDRLNRPGLRFSPEVDAALLAFDWPGDLHQVRNTVERAVLMCDGEMIQPSDLPLEAPQSYGSEPLSLANAERKHIQKTLGEVDWDITRCAHILEVDRATLLKKIKEYGLKADVLEVPAD